MNLRWVILVVVTTSLLVTGALVSSIFWAPGFRTMLPERNIAVTDTDGDPLTDYQLYIYRCTNPGSRLDRAFVFDVEEEIVFSLETRDAFAFKRRGGEWLAPDYFSSYEPTPYWVACANKPGYESRRFGLSGLQTDAEVNVTFALREGEEPGPEVCVETYGDCSPCRAFDYFFYWDQRYVHSACWQEEQTSQTQ